MKLTTLTILAGLSLALASGPARSDGPAHGAPDATSSGELISSYTVPPPVFDPTFPERSSDPTWEDTADGDLDDSSDLVPDSDPKVHLEIDLHNDVHDPLLEDNSIERVDLLTPEQMGPLESEWRDPHAPASP